MPQTPHIERHFTASDSVRDVVIGMSDGLTVPFALAAGLSGVVGSTVARHGDVGIIVLKRPFAVEHGLVPYQWP